MGEAERFSTPPSEKVQYGWTASPNNAFEWGAPYCKLWWAEAAELIQRHRRPGMKLIVLGDFNLRLSDTFQHVCGGYAPERPSPHVDYVCARLREVGIFCRRPSLAAMIPRHRIRGWRGLSLRGSITSGASCVTS